MAYCRICLEPGECSSAGCEAEALVAPCSCRGSQAFVHFSCLREWCQAKDNYVSCTECKQCYFGDTALRLAKFQVDRMKRRRKGDPDRLYARECLAMEIQDQGRHSEAAAMLREVLAIREHDLGR